MLITCKCLNVAIDTQGSDVQDIDISSLGLTSAEQNDEFFKEKLNAVEHGRISKVQSSLVQMHNTGSWIIHCCLNCSLNTHAIHRDKGAAVVLFNKALLTNPADIAALKSSEKYSQVFRIVVNHTDVDVFAAPPTKFSVSQLPAPVQTALAALQQQLGECVQREAARAEERVRQFSELHNAALEEFREQAHRDHRVLVKLLCEAQEKLSSTTAKNPTALETPSRITDIHNVSTSPFPNLATVLPQSPLSSVQNNLSTISGHGRPSATPKQPLSAGKQLSASTEPRRGNCTNPLSPNVNASNSRPERRLPVRLFGQGSGRSSGTGSSFDAEGLFDLEGMDESPADVLPSEEETDTDDSGSHDEGIHIPRARGLHSTLAKSLPVNVPTYLPPEKRNGDDREDERLPQDPVDIAASIKALAKSLHGDANVFGDLPRPRFSTQI